jgi:hypothetical protein
VPLASEEMHHQHQRCCHWLAGDFLRAPIRDRFQTYRSTFHGRMGQININGATKPQQSNIMFAFRTWTWRQVISIRKSKVSYNILLQLDSITSIYFDSMKLNKLIPQ